MIETIQKILPWLPTLPVSAKVSLTVLIIAAGSFFIAVMWSQPLPSEPKVSIQKIQDMLIELAEIQANWEARWREVEPLATRVKATIEKRFPSNSAEITTAQNTYANVTDVARVLKTQLQVIKEQLNNEPN